MDWTAGIQNAINYIENHITDELDYEDIAKEAFCSSFYFQRIFSILCGYSLGEYIRNRRLTLAGIELSAGNARVIDTALKYGYESPESFARAFSKFHGISPSQAKKNRSKLRSFSPLSVKVILKGGNVMDYKVVKRKSFKVIEKVKRQEIDDEANKNSIPAFWEQSHNDGTVKNLLELTNDRTNIFGICYGNTRSDKKTFDYSIAALCDDNCKAEQGFRINEIPERTWLVFECIGAMPDAMQEIWHKICTEIFPTSAYEPTYEMDIEAYPAGKMNSPDYKCEVWIPVKKSK